MSLNDVKVVLYPGQESFGSICICDIRRARLEGPDLPAREWENGRKHVTVGDGADFETGRERFGLKSVLRNFLSSENAGEAIAFLRSRGPLAHILAPEWVQRLVLQAAGASRSVQCLASWSRDAESARATAGAKTNFIVIADDAIQEGAAIASLKLRGETKAYGLFHHVLPAILCGANGLAGGRPTRNLKRYALLCIPRSGSRYLAAVLSNRGIGAVKEHIREPLANIISEGKLGFAQAVTALEMFGQRNQIFGTKLISTFLLKASNRSMCEVEANVAWMIDRGYRFVHIERPLNEAVVSSCIAFQMRKWHFFGELDEVSRAKLDGLVFESGAVWEEYVRFRAEHILMDSVVSRHHIPSIPYSEIQADIDQVVGQVCGIIQADPDKLERGSARIPLATRTESPTYSKFASGLDELLDKRKQELHARTVGKVRALASLNRQAAEKLVSEASS
jgi:LPS sulfotransferase NodH